jgi:hypothetical protein
MTDPDDLFVMKVPARTLICCSGRDLAEVGNRIKGNRSGKNKTVEPEIVQANFKLNVCLYT